MSSHPDAVAFVRAYLREPADATARLVFADWLEETGAPHNRAWAYYLRLRADADTHPAGSPERTELEAEADGYAPKIRARLTIPAARFVASPRSLLRLLPAANITVNLAYFDVPLPVLELIPESVARDNLVLPLDRQGRTLSVVTTDPYNHDTIQKLQFILNCDIVVVRGEADDIQAAIDRLYGQTETESVDSVHYLYPQTPQLRLPPFALGPATAVDPDPVRQSVRQYLEGALIVAASALRFRTGPRGVVMAFREPHGWVEWSTLPTEHGRAVVDRIAELAGIVPVELHDSELPEHRLWGAFPVVFEGNRYVVAPSVYHEPSGRAMDVELHPDGPAAGPPPRR